MVEVSKSGERGGRGERREDYIARACRGGGMN